MTTVISSEMIKTLRERTGVGMSKCKEALEEAKGDMELAIANLRKAGIASAVKKEGRSTNEGVIAVAENNQCVALVEINTETDFVAKNEKFGQFAKDVAHQILETHPASLEQFLEQKFSKDASMTVDQYRATLVQSIGENIQIKRMLLIPKERDQSVGVYSHLGGKIVTAVIISGSNTVAGLAKDIAMHTAAASPEYVAPENIPPAVIENEKDIARNQMKDKPANIIEKILEGKLNAFYDSLCLVRQKYIRDDSKTVQQFVNDHSKTIGKPLTILKFVRWSVGQGA